MIFKSVRDSCTPPPMIEHASRFDVDDATQSLVVECELYVYQIAVLFY